MKKRILFAFAILTVLSLAIAAFAYGGLSTNVADDKASCCKKDSCPMMKHDGEHKSGEHAKGEHKCCGDSCPMKGEHKSGDHATGEHKCCGDSGPMKKKVGTTTAVSTSEEGKSCCDNCECCKAKAKTDTAAV